jgi:hypothetical protein
MCHKVYVQPLVIYLSRIISAHWQRATGCACDVLDVILRIGHAQFGLCQVSAYLYPTLNHSNYDIIFISYSRFQIHSICGRFSTKQTQEIANHHLHDVLREEIKTTAAWRIR